MIKIGFTGTRHGMSEYQKKEFKNLMITKKCEEFHHGMCVGSDEQAHLIVKELEIKVIGHPPTFKKFTANCKCDIVKKAFDYLKRNKNIVDESDILIATPDTKEKIRSGTWSTIRYARIQNKEIYIEFAHLYPEATASITVAGVFASPSFLTLKPFVLIF